MRLRQVLGGQLNICAYVSHLIDRFKPDPQFRLEGLKPSLVALPLVQTATLASESLDVGDKSESSPDPKRWLQRRRSAASIVNARPNSPVSP